MRRSIAIFMVLFFIIALFGVVAKLFEIYNSYTSNNFGRVINQNSLLIRDVKNILENVEINSSDQLEEILISFPFSSKDGDFRGVIDINLVSNRININNYLKKKSINRAIDNFLTLLFDKYEINDPIFLKDIFLDTLDKDLEERSGFSEIKLEDSNFVNGYIDKNVLLKIIEYYYKKSEDDNIYKIPWDRLITFYDTPAYCSFVDKEIMEVLGYEKSCIEIIENPKFKKKLEKLGIISFTKNRPIIISLEIDYILEDSNDRFFVYYDLNKKRIIGIESSPTY